MSSIKLNYIVRLKLIIIIKNSYNSWKSIHLIYLTIKETTIMKRVVINIMFCLLGIFIINVSFAKSTMIRMYIVTPKNHGKKVGTIIARDSQYGLLLIPRLYDLSPGEHGIHVHTKPSCAQNGMAAGEHLDPRNTGKHLGPYNNNGHLGDLPVLYVNQNGRAITPMLAPKLTVNNIKKHAIIIHVGGDNYSDSPKPLGGGGERLACGVIK